MALGTEAGTDLTSAKQLVTAGAGTGWSDCHAVDGNRCSPRDIAGRQPGTRTGCPRPGSRLSVPGPVPATDQQGGLTEHSECCFHCQYIEVVNIHVKGEENHLEKLNLTPGHNFRDHQCRRPGTQCGLSRWCGQVPSPPPGPFSIRKVAKLSFFKDTINIYVASILVEPNV